MFRSSSEEDVGVEATHPVDEDVARQGGGGGGLLQAAEPVHHLAVVEGQRDLRQTTSCSTERVPLNQSQGK